MSVSTPPSTRTHWYPKVTPVTPSLSLMAEVLAVRVCVTRSAAGPEMVGLPVAAVLAAGTTLSEARLVCSSALGVVAASVNDTFTLSVLPASASMGVYVALVAVEMFASVPPLATRIHW